MKLIQAYIKHHKLTDVTLALHKVEGITGMSVLEVQGFGRGKARGPHHRIEDDLVDFIPHVKLEIFCRTDLVEPIITAIRTAAHTGLRGDGKIYITPCLEAYRISTGEQGPTAV
jgi:nitrogen regulatory protein PII